MGMNVRKSQTVLPQKLTKQSNKLLHTTLIHFRFQERPPGLNNRYGAIFQMMEETGVKEVTTQASRVSASPVKQDCWASCWMSSNSPIYRLLNSSEEAAWQLLLNILPRCSKRAPCICIWSGRSHPPHKKGLYCFSGSKINFLNRVIRNLHDNYDIYFSEGDSQTGVKSWSRVAKRSSSRTAGSYICQSLAIPEKSRSVQSVCNPITKNCDFFD